ncbi:MAG: hypothetical protein B6U73_04765, partial [Desulfurococcales archaeon ex4484_204]
MDVDLLVKDAVIITVNEGNEVFRGSIAIADGLIVDVARGGGGGYTAGEVVDGRGMVAMPGLINTHVHSYQAFLRGYPDDLPFVEWCNNVLFPFYEAVHYYQSLGDYSIGYHASLLSAVEMVKSGVTCAVSQDTLNPELPKAFLRVGMRVVYAVTLADRWLPKSCLKESAPRELVRGAEDVIKRWHGYSNNMVRCMLAPSAPFTCSEELLREVAKSSTLNNVGISMHINETRYEVRWALKELGMPVVKYLDSLGILSSRFLAVHCVWCSDEELEVIRVRGAHVSHNPES